MDEFFDELDYKVVLKRLYEQRHAQNRSFSHQFIAQRLGVASKSIFGSYVRGERRIPVKHIDLLVAIFKLTKRQEQYLKLIIQYGQESDSLKRQGALDQIAHFRKHRIRHLELNEFGIFQDWHTPVIWGVLSYFPFSGNYDQLAGHLNPPVTPHQARLSIELLTSLGLVVRGEDGFYHRTEHSLAIDPSQRAQIRRYHKKGLELAAVALDNLPVELRSHKVMEMIVSQDSLNQVQEVLDRCSAQLRAIAASTKNPDRVIRCIFCMHPATNPISSQPDNPPGDHETCSSV